MIKENPRLEEMNELSSRSRSIGMIFVVWWEEFVREKRSGGGNLWRRGRSESRPCGAFIH